MNSFDVFDTLIARRFINNDNLLFQIGKTLSIPNFVQLRKSADNGKRNIFEIYEFLVESNFLTAKTAKQALELEYDLEIQNCFPIAENLLKVNDGDLLISDMYLTAPMILEMVRSAGLQKQVTIYQSNGDKHKGKIWDKLKGYPLKHLGDNKKSDYEEPLKREIHAELYPGTDFTEIEKYLNDIGLKNLSLLIREVRLRLINSFHVKDFLLLANQLNLPSLLILSEIINRRHESKNIVFLGRDCQLLQKIYSNFYKTTNSFYLPFSRKIAFKNPTLASEYLTYHIPKNSVLFDLNSTGTTWANICKIEPFCVDVAVYLNNQQYINEAHTLPNSFSFITENNRIISNIMYEIVNFANHGSISELEKITDGVIVSKYSDIELPENIILDLHKPIDLSIQLKEFYKDGVKNDFSKLPTTTLIEIYKNLILQISKSKKKVGHYIENILQNENQHLKDLNGLVK